MTVKELIEELKCYSEDCEVVVEADKGRFLVVNEVDLDTEDDFVVIK
ncbi:hypothetical protein J6TS2_50740 [Heyndrickxia sporothermodurans]|nr:hypothetical protein J6TS2_50740 [Heyndrickxia sporothermodurans]